MKNSSPLPWQDSRCRVPVWMGGYPAGFCNNEAYGHQLPKAYLQKTRGLFSTVPYCFGHACPDHGGPEPHEIRIFQDGCTQQGRQMWCAVMPDFINLQESPAGFDGNPNNAVRKLKAALAQEKS